MEIVGKGANKYLFIEQNLPDMDWLDAPEFTIVRADSERAALLQWVGSSSRFTSTDHIEELIENLGPGESLKDSWGVEVKMFKIDCDLSDMPKKWLNKTIEKIEAERQIEK